jgi:hypothetical protein
MAKVIGREKSSASSFDIYEVYNGKVKSALDALEAAIIKWYDDKVAQVDELQAEHDRICHDVRY